MDTRAYILDGWGERVDCKGKAVIVHDAEQVIAALCVGLVSKIEVVALAAFNVSPIDLDKPVTVWSRLLMCHAKSVAELVNRSAYGHAARLLELQSLRLFREDHAYIRIATFCRITLHEDGWLLIASLLGFGARGGATSPTNINKLETRNCDMVLICCSLEDVLHPAGDI